MKKQLKSLAAGFLYIFCNYFINNIPSWTIRKLLYRLCGMKIGKYSRIMMKVIVTIPWRISIGDNTIINEYSYLDGRGGLTIGNRVNVSLYSMIVTGTHDYRKATFEYFTEGVCIEDDVWIGMRAIILNGCVLKKGCIIAAGSTVSPRMVCDMNTIYSGVPAAKKKEYKFEERIIDRWKVHFR